MQEITHELLARAAEKPDNFRMLERVTFGQGETPISLSEEVGDELLILALDCESSGLNHATNELIELGLVTAKYSPSQNKITQIVSSDSFLRQPDNPITAEITELTGITNDVLAGKEFCFDDIKHYFDGDPIIIAHNASFDRKLVEKYFPQISNARWACSATEADFSSLEIKSRKQEDLLRALGFFYDGHRANTDCLALLFLLHLVPDALQSLIQAANVESYIVEAKGAPFDVKDELKLNGFFWNASDRVWSKKTTDQNACLDLLESLYGGGERAQVETLSSRTRFKA